MITNTYSGVAIARAAVMPSPLHVAGAAAKPQHWSVATHHAIPAMKRRAAAATVASVNRGTT
jgi:hypothetical protein